jgi:hypothetical protein
MVVSDKIPPQKINSAIAEGSSAGEVSLSSQAVSCSSKVFNSSTLAASKPRKDSHGVPSRDVRRPADFTPDAGH